MSRPLPILLAILGALPGAILAASVALGTTEPAQGEGAPLASAAEIVADGARTRLRLTLSQPVAHRAFVLEGPDRVVLELPEVEFRLPVDKARRRQGLVASFRYGLFAPGRSRVVIDLTQPAKIAALEIGPGGEDGTSILALELARSDRESFRQAAAEARAAVAGPAPGPSPAPSAQNDDRPLVMIDAGHGGIDPGAIASSGVFEKDIVLDFAHRLGQRLGASGRYRVEMTRERDTFVTLSERLRLARAAQAQLFISIHADSISSAPTMHGATIYTGAERATDAASATLAERENKADAAAGLDAHDPVTEVTDILQDLTHRETRSFSQRFAKRLLGQLAPVMKMSVKPHREAGFKVLRSPDVPSVLVELGYLSNKTDLEKLMSSEWRDRATAAMAAAIDHYFKPNAAKDPRRDGARSAAAPAAVSP